MSYDFKGRKVEVTDLEWEHGEGAYALGAYFEDSGAELTDKELDEFNDYCAAELYQDAYENAASDAYDRYKDAMKYGE